MRIKGIQLGSRPLALNGGITAHSAHCCCHISPKGTAGLSVGSLNDGWDLVPEGQERRISCQGCRGGSAGRCPARRSPEEQLACDCRQLSRSRRAPDAPQSVVTKKE